MNWYVWTEIFIIAAVVLGFVVTIWYLVTHNPNYEPKEIMKQPWKIFDLIDHAKEQMTENLQKIREQTQQSLDAAREVKAQVQETVRQVQETVAEVRQGVQETIQQIAPEKPSVEVIEEAPVQEPEAVPAQEPEVKD